MWYSNYMKNKKIIAISGTHGTGKSRLAYDITSKLRDLGFNTVVLDEIARTCPFSINQSADFRSQSWLINKQLTTELEMIDRFDYIVTDRAVLDPYAYGKSLHMPGMDNYLPIVRDHINTYYRKSYLIEPVSFNYQVDDGVRDMDPEFRMRVHENLLTGYRMCGINYQLVFNVMEIYRDLFTL